jgi:hypothetical protein
VLTGGYNEINQATRTLASKNFDVAASLNQNIQQLHTLKRTVTEVDQNVSKVDGKVATMKFHAGKTIKEINTRMTAIEEACAHTVTVLTA